MSEHNEIFDTVKAIISRITRIPSQDIRDDARIQAELGIDSLTSLEILAVCEKELNIQIDEGECADMETVQQFFEYVLAKTAG